MEVKGAETEDGKQGAGLRPVRLGHGGREVRLRGPPDVRARIWRW